MKAKYQFLLKNVGILALSNFASKILVFLLVPVYTNVLSTEEFGVYDLTVSTTAMLFPVLTANILDAVMRFLMDKDGRGEQVASIGFKSSLLGCVVAAALLLVVRGFKSFGVIRGLEIYIILYFVFYLFNQYFIQLAKGLERIGDMAVASVLGIIVMLLTNILFLLVFKLGLKGFFAANILAQAVPTFYFIVRLRFWKYRLFVKMDTQLLREMLHYSVPLIATSLGWSINNAGDKYIVTLILGLGANGLLAVAYKIPGALGVLQNTFISAWNISGIKEYGSEAAEEFYGRVFLTINLLMSAACSVLILFSKPIAHVLYAKDFFEAWRYVPFLLIASVWSCAGGILGPILSAQKNSRAMAMSAIYGIVTNLVLNVLLAYAMGIEGVTIATAISTLVIFAVRKKTVGSAMDIPNFWKVTLTWALLCAQACIAVWLGVWALELAVMAVLVIVNLDTIKLTVASVGGLVRKK